uniref:Protein CutA n=1 Tax=Accipiter nisus TaxID=211598 RepID=A0A8B9N6C6_9AVES
SPGPSADCTTPGVVTLSLLMYPVLRSLALQLHSAVTGSYVSGTHSIAFINCLNEQIAKDIARYRDASPTSASCACEWERVCSVEGLSLTLFLCVCFHFRSIHPFEIPEIISLPIDQGNPLYLKWIEESVPRD